MTPIRSPIAGSDVERGSVLVLAMLMVTATLVFGLSYLGSAVDRHTRIGISTDRLEATTLAEGAAERALFRLFQGSTSDESSVGLGNGTFSHQTVTESDGYAITGSGTVNGVTVRCVVHVDGVTSTVGNVDGPVYAGGSLAGDVGALTWAEPFRYGGSLFLTPNGPVESVTSAPTVSLNTGLFAATEVDLSGTLGLDGGDFVGHYLATGNVQIKGPATLSGSVFTSRSLHINGRNKDVELRASGGTGVLFIQGNLTANNVAHLLIEGSIFVEGSVSLTNIDELTITGSILTNGGLDLGTDTGTIAFDPALTADTLPPTVTVGGPPIITPTAVAWRRFEFGP